MKRSTYSVPAMYADHHVQRVRQALMEVQGVKSVLASAAKRAVVVQYDDAVVSNEALGRAIGEAGYPVGEAVELEPSLQPSKDGSAWHTVIQRVTTTSRRDLEMSGDFRRY